MTTAHRFFSAFLFMVLTLLPAAAEPDWWSCEGDFNRVTFLEISPQSDAVAVGYATHAAVWDLRQGRYLPLRDLGPAEAVVPAWHHAAFSNDGRYLALVGKALVVVDLYEQKHTILADGDGITAVAFAPDGLLVSAGRRLAIWDVPRARQLGTLAGDLGDSDQLAFAPDGTLVVAFTEFDRTHLGFWDWADKTLRERHRYDKVADLWFIQSGELYLKLPTGLTALDLASGTNRWVYSQAVDDVSSDGRYLALFTLAVVEGGGTLVEPMLVVLGDKNSLIRWPPPFDNLTKLVLFPDARRAVAASKCGDLILLDATKQPLAKLSSQPDCYRIKTPDSRVEIGGGCAPGQVAHPDLLSTLVVKPR